MAKYLLLKHYRGGPKQHPNAEAPMDDWTPDEISAHMKFMYDMMDDLRERGEFVDAQALAPQGEFVRYGGEGKPPVLHKEPLVFENVHLSQRSYK